MLSRISDAIYWHKVLKNKSRFKTDGRNVAAKIAKPPKADEKEDKASWKHNNKIIEVGVVLEGPKIFSLTMWQGSNSENSLPGPWRQMKYCILWVIKSAAVLRTPFNLAWHNRPRHNEASPRGGRGVVKAGASNHEQPKCLFVPTTRHAQLHTLIRSGRISQDVLLHMPVGCRAVVPR